MAPADATNGEADSAPASVEFAVVSASNVELGVSDSDRLRARSAAVEAVNALPVSSARVELSRRAAFEAWRAGRSEAGASLSRFGDRPRPATPLSAREKEGVEASGDGETSPCPDAAIAGLSTVDGLDGVGAAAMARRGEFEAGSALWIDSVVDDASVRLVRAERSTAAWAEISEGACCR